MLLIEKPNAYIAAQVPISETGTASAGMMVADTERRNRKITRTTSPMAIASVSWTSSTALADRDRAVDQHLHVDRRPAPARGTAAAAPCTASTTSTVLASGWRWIASTTARLSLNQLATLSFSTLSMTWAISFELDRRAVAIGHDDVAVFGRVRIAPVASSVTFCAGADQRADRRVGIRLGEDAADVVERNVARGGRHRIDLDAHGEFLRAVDQHLGDARKLRNLLGQHDLGIFVDRRQRQRRRVQADEQHREVARIDLAEARRRRHLDRQPALRDRQARSARRAPRRRYCG